MKTKNTEILDTLKDIQLTLHELSIRVEKVEVDAHARNASDLIQGQDFKLGFENIENLEAKVAKRTETLKKQQTRADKLRELHSTIVEAVK